MNEKKYKVAVLGARGYVGQEILKLLEAHENVSSISAYSRELQGQAIADVVDGYSDASAVYQTADFEEFLEFDLDVLFLALPNGVAYKHRQLWQELAKSTCIIDLSSDFRFEDQDWIYSQPETCEKSLTSHKMISNPGCYATAMQLAILPINHLLNRSPVVFGVSGFSGAGSKPSDKNNPQLLKDNLMAYQLVDHIHEREVSRVLGRSICFTPHVAAFFRGIHLTVHLSFHEPIDLDRLIQIYSNHYADAELIHVSSNIPQVAEVQHQHEVHIGGFAVDQNRVVVCVALDNLLKGAATQALQNMNLALGLEMNTGLSPAQHLEFLL